ncbi:MAG: GDP-mannose 4,6-dehydratase [Actinomycetota bacterium]|jgi:GDP-4-dehydro-6-deoxy-D-mannose reductase|nr:GDP-mannose 4,6-dehydratase [Actinomycetota bacterium]
MRALITGASGFVGGHLQEYLSSIGDEAVLLNPDLDVADEEALIKELELLSGEAVDAVYHLAAIAHVGNSFGSATEVFRVNVLGTANVLEGSRKMFPQARFLYVSSSEVYGKVSPKLLPVNENAPLAPLSPYAASKAAAEQVVLQAFRAYNQPVLVARPFNHIGPGQSDSYVVSALAKRVLNAKKNGRRSIIVGNLESRRDFTDVRDVVRAYHQMIQFGEPGGTYNVCSGRSISITDLAQKLNKLAFADVFLERDAQLVRDIEVSDIYGDPSKCHTDLSWKPVIPIEESLRDVLEWWSARLAVG